MSSKRVLFRKYFTFGPFTVWYGATFNEVLFCNKKGTQSGIFLKLNRGSIRGSLNPKIIAFYRPSWGKLTLKCLQNESFLWSMSLLGPLPVGVVPLLMKFYFVTKRDQIGQFFEQFKISVPRPDLRVSLNPKIGPFYRPPWGKLTLKCLHSGSVFWSMSLFDPLTAF